MKTKYLLPNLYKKIGWLIWVPAVVLGFLLLLSDKQPEIFHLTVPAIFINEVFGESALIGMIENNIYDELIALLLIVSSIFVAFSKEKDEDELISKIRLESLVWATYWNYGILLLAFLLVYDVSFYYVMVCNLFTILILFIIKFNWSVLRLKRSVSYEE